MSLREWTGLPAISSKGGVQNLDLNWLVLLQRPKRATYRVKGLLQSYRPPRPQKGAGPMRRKKGSRIGGWKLAHRFLFAQFTSK